MLYWAEGSKSRNSVMFVNSDPEMVRCFVAFLRTQFAVRDEAFRVDCNLFADHLERQREIEQFWLDTLDLPSSCLRKSTVNVYSKHSQKKRRNKLPLGDRPGLLRPLDGDRPEHLRRNPGIRRVRAAGVARMS